MSSAEDQTMPRFGALHKGIDAITILRLAGHPLSPEPAWNQQLAEMNCYAGIHSGPVRELNALLDDRAHGPAEAAAGPHPATSAKARPGIHSGYQRPAQ